MLILDWGGLPGCLGVQGLPDGGAGIMDVMRRRIGLNGDPHGYTCPPGVSSSPLLPGTSVSPPYGVSKFVWLGEKPRVSFTTKLRFPSLLSLFPYSFCRYRTFATHYLRRALALRGQVPSCMGWGNPKRAPSSKLRYH